MFSIDLYRRTSTYPTARCNAAHPEHASSFGGESVTVPGVNELVIGGMHILLCDDHLAVLKLVLAGPAA